MPLLQPPPHPGIVINSKCMLDEEDGIRVVVQHYFPEVQACYERALEETDPARRKALLTFVIAGGGPTGVELAGALAELTRLVLARDYPDIDVKDTQVGLKVFSRRVAGTSRVRAREGTACPPHFQDH